MIARPQQSSPRVFPAIDSSLYAQPSPSEEESQRQSVQHLLISLSHCNLTKAQLFFARNLRPKEHLARFLIQHRLAFEAELAAKWQRADFYWQQVQNQLKSLVKQDSLWQALAKEIKHDYPESESLKDLVLLRQRLVEELLIDTHCGFFNGLNQADTTERGDKSNVQKATFCDRSFAHISFIEALLPHSSLENEAWLSLLASPWQQQINHARANKTWRDAIRVCRHRLKFFPNSVPYQTELADVQAEEVLAGLQNGILQKHYLANANHLAQGIGKFEILAKTYPHNLVIYDYLGNLHYLHAVQLGNSQQVAEGLVAVEKALVYAPYLKKALDTRNSLIQVMNQTQAQVKQMLAALRRQPNTRLNAQGQKLNAQAKKGFKLRDKYLKSKQPAIVQEAIKLAQAMQVWNKLAGLPAYPTNQQALALYEGLSSILQQPPPDKSSIPDEWQKVSQTKHELAELPAEPICNFLIESLWKKQNPTPTITPPPLPNAPIILQPTVAKPQPSQEPFLPWLFSGRHLRLKAEMAVAITALLTAGGLGLYEFSVRTSRARAYERILTAEQRNQPLAIMDEAEIFLARTPLSGRDAREDQVKNLYTKTFVNWFLQQPELTEDSNVEHYAKRYQQLIED